MSEGGVSFKTHPRAVCYSLAIKFRWSGGGGSKSAWHRPEIGMAWQENKKGGRKAPFCFRIVCVGCRGLTAW